MKSIKIKKWRHRASGKLAAFNEDFGMMKDLHYVSSWRIMFCEDCRHELYNDDQYDWSKLFGFQLGLFGIHRNSYRFGWRYIPETGKIEICKIIYTNDGGIHIMEKLAEVDINTDHLYQIAINLVNGIVTFSIDGSIPVNGYNGITTPFSSLRFGNGFYFGRNRKAPHEMTIIVEREEEKI